MALLSFPLSTHHRMTRWIKVLYTKGFDFLFHFPLLTEKIRVAEVVRWFERTTDRNVFQLKYASGCLVYVQFFITIILF